MTSLFEPDGSLPRQVACGFRFELSAEADPGVLPRALEPFAKLGLIPARVSARRRPGDDGGELALIIDCLGLDAWQADHVARFLAATVGITGVELCRVPASELAA